MIDREKVYKVYVESNPIHSGDYYYSSKHRQYAEEVRDYPIADGEVDDKMVSKVVKMLNSRKVKLGDNKYYTYIDARLYIAFLVP